MACVHVQHRHAGRSGRPWTFPPALLTRIDTCCDNPYPAAACVRLVTRYNMTSDPWSMYNLINNTHGTLETTDISAIANELHAVLHTWFDCEGDACP